MPAAAGVKTPLVEILPPVAVHVTALLKRPVPKTEAAQVAVCDVVIDAGDAATVMDVMVNGAAATAIFAEPETLV